MADSPINSVSSDENYSSDEEYPSGDDFPFEVVVVTTPVVPEIPFVMSDRERILNFHENFPEILGDYRSDDDDDEGEYDGDDEGEYDGDDEGDEDDNDEGKGGDA